MATKVKAVKKPGISDAFKQEVRGLVASTIDQYFKATLGTEQGVVDYFMALIQEESGYRPGVTGISVSEVPTARQAKASSGAKSYMSSQVIKNILATGTPQQRANVQSGKVAQGLTQCMGWNIVRGASGSGKCLVEETGRADLIAALCVNAGDSIEAKLLGSENIPTNILAGLTVLDSKYKAARKASGGWRVYGGAVFSTRIAASVGAYLGTSVDVATGKTVQSYVQDIVGGNSYVKANGDSAGTGGTATKTALNATTGPTTNAPTNSVSIPGCSKAA